MPKISDRKLKNFDEVYANYTQVSPKKILKLKLKKLTKLRNSSETRRCVEVNEDYGESLVIDQKVRF